MAARATGMAAGCNGHRDGGSVHHDGGASVEAAAIQGRLLAPALLEHVCMMCCKYLHDDAMLFACRVMNRIKHGY